MFISENLDNNRDLEKTCHLSTRLYFLHLLQGYQHHNNRSGGERESFVMFTDPPRWVEAQEKISLSKIAKKATLYLDLALLFLMKF